MARPRSIPTYRHHKQSGQAVVTLTDPSGRRKDVLLGTYGTSESRIEYSRVIGEWEANNQRLAAKELGPDWTVNELILRFWQHVEKHYRHPDGTPTSEVANFRYALKPLRELYGRTTAAKFGPLALKAIRKPMIDAGLARGEINSRIGRVKRMFKWAVAEELIPASVHHGLLAVEGLKAGRTEAKDSPPILPVSDDDVDATLPKLNRHVAGMVQVQRLTGMRPGEVCILRRRDIDMSGNIWFYRPEHHKTQHHGKARVVGIGPKAQEILKGFFTLNIDDYIFSPRRMMEERYAEMRQARKSKVPPSQVCRKKSKAKRRPGERFRRESYGRAVLRGCIKANVPHWHPNQLRHSYATEIRKKFGLEGAQVGLGHSKADVTQVYAEVNAALVVKIASEVG